ncbi:v-SNARE, coiled-coil homology domain [Dillenia turbinata]|uniref:V-SNARE, coiled-coil homology domain n=1 Tax=Dillenia turbinata TaxID=194707 RepID=A0AAN8U7R5_9MAGN
MVKLTMIARVTDGLPLAEGLEGHRDLQDAEFFKQQVNALFKNLSKVQNEASRMSIETGRVCYLTMCDRAYPKKLAFQYLEDLKNEFERVSGNQIETAARPYAFIKFDRLYIFNTNTRTQRNIAKLNDELYEVHQIMTRNVQEVLGVGEKLDQVSQMSTHLTSESRIYADKARDLNRQWYLMTVASYGADQTQVPAFITQWALATQEAYARPAFMIGSNSLTTMSLVLKHPGVTDRLIAIVPVAFMGLGMMPSYRSGLRCKMMRIANRPRIELREMLKIGVGDEIPPLQHDLGCKENRRKLKHSGTAREYTQLQTLSLSHQKKQGQWDGRVGEKKGKKKAENGDNSDDLVKQKNWEVASFVMVHVLEVFQNVKGLLYRLCQRKEMTQGRVCNNLDTWVVDEVIIMVHAQGQGTTSRLSNNRNVVSGHPCLARLLGVPMGDELGIVASFPEVKFLYFGHGERISNQLKLGMRKIVPMEAAETSTFKKKKRNRKAQIITTYLDYTN